MFAADGSDADILGRRHRVYQNVSTPKHCALEAIEHRPYDKAIVMGGTTRLILLGCHNFRQ